MHLPPVNSPPEPSMKLLTSDSSAAKRFREDAHKWNSAISLASMGEQLSISQDVHILKA